MTVRTAKVTLPAARHGRGARRGKALRSFAQWLVSAYPGRLPLTFTLVPHDAVQSIDGKGGFAVYLPAKNVIYQATGDRRLDADAMAHVLAHEYKHYLQRCARTPYTHRGVARWAWARVREYKDQRQYGRTAKKTSRRRTRGVLA